MSRTVLGYFLSCRSATTKPGRILMSIDDLHLCDALERLAKGQNAQAWSTLLRQAGEDLRRLAARLAGPGQIADDAVQETLLQVRDHAGRFVRDPRDPDGSARRWLMGVAAHAALTLRRADARRRARDIRGALAHQPSPSPSQAMERSELSGAVRDALAGLPEHERLAVSLRHVAGFEYPAIAEQLGCPVGTAKARVSRGLERLRDRLARRDLAFGLIGLAGLLTTLEASDVVGSSALVRAATLVNDTSLHSTMKPYQASSATKAILMATLATSAVLVSTLSILLLRPTVAAEAAVDQPGSNTVDRTATAATATATGDTPAHLTAASVATESSPEAERAVRDQAAAVIRLVGPHRPGTRRASELVPGGFLFVLERDHSREDVVKVTEDPHGFAMEVRPAVQVTMGTADGKIIWQGPATTEADRQQMPPEAAAFVARRVALEQQQLKKMNDARAHVAALVAPYAGTFHSESTMIVEDILAITIDRDGSPWLIAATLDGDRLWEGPVGSAAERELMPAEIARALGYERFSVGAGSGNLDVTASPEAEAAQAQ